jgi:Tfp pilus assembly PilM family ATPase
VLIIDIGHSKTIVDIVTNNNLLFTRTIGIGIGDIIAHISETLKLSLTEARDTLIKMDMDLSSFDNTISTLQDKEINITKSKLKSIFEYANEVYISIIDEVLISIKAASFNDFSDFNRIYLNRWRSKF